MIKVTIKKILGLIASLPIVLPSLAYDIHLHFEKQGSYYTSPVIYLTGNAGQNPNVALRDGIPTTAGVDANEFNFTKFNSVSFQRTPENDSTELKIIHASTEENSFCNQLNLSLLSSREGNKILFPSTFPKLTTITSCHFKIVSLNDTNNEVTENKITFIFNYTLKGWLGDLGKGTKAQNSANIIKDLRIDPNSTTITLVNKNLVDLSPLMGFIKVQLLGLPYNQIKVIPDSIGNLINLKSLYLPYNQIEVIPESIGNLTNLKNLYLPYNKIEVIPESIGNLTNLQKLALYYNRIGVIPDAIGNLRSLQQLNLMNNQIKVIPNAIGNLTNLYELALIQNQIEVLPDTIENLTNLYYLSFKNNEIQWINKSLYDWMLEKKVDLSNNPGTDYHFGN